MFFFAPRSYKDVWYPNTLLQQSIYMVIPVITIARLEPMKLLLTSKINLRMGDAWVPADTWYDIALN